MTFDLLSEKLKSVFGQVHVEQKGTNTFDIAKRLDPEKGDAIVLLFEQTKGRGKGERVFLSQKGGIYFSLCCFDLDVKKVSLPKTVLNAGFAVYDTLVSYGFNPVLKWPNDVLVNGKKVCGILSEAVTCGDKVSLFCGVGINVNTKDFGELNSIATSLSIESGKDIDIFQFAFDAIKHVYEQVLSDYDITELFASKCEIVGKTVKVKQNDESYNCVVKGITPDGFLKAEKDGCEIKILCGDISPAE